MDSSLESTLEDFENVRERFYHRYLRFLPDISKHIKISSRSESIHIPDLMKQLNSELVTTIFDEPEDSGVEPSVSQDSIKSNLIFELNDIQTARRNHYRDAVIEITKRRDVYWSDDAIDSLPKPSHPDFTKVVFTKLKTAVPFQRNELDAVYIWVF